MHASSLFVLATAALSSVLATPLAFEKRKALIAYGPPILTPNAESVWVSVIESWPVSYRN